MFSDWVWHAGLPLLAYLSLLITALVMRRAPEGALYGVEAVELLLLFIGIHNAWDAAVWIATSAEPPAPPSSDPIARFQDDDAEAPPAQLARRRKAGDDRTDDGDVDGTTGHRIGSAARAAGGVDARHCARAV